MGWRLVRIAKALGSAHQRTMVITYRSFLYIRKALSGSHQTAPRLRHESPIRGLLERSVPTSRVDSRSSPLTLTTFFAENAPRLSCIVTATFKFAKFAVIAEIWYACYLLLTAGDLLIFTTLVKAIPYHAHHRSR